MTGQDLIDDAAGQIDRLDAVQRAAALLATGRTDRLVDECLISHD